MFWRPASGLLTSQTVFSGAAAGARWTSQPLASIQGAPVGPASTASLLAAEFIRMPGQTASVIAATCCAPLHGIFDASPAAIPEDSGLLQSTIARSLRRASARSGSESGNPAANTRQLMGVPLIQSSDLGSLQADGQNNGTQRLCGDTSDIWFSNYSVAGTGHSGDRSLGVLYENQLAETGGRVRIRLRLPGMGPHAQAAIGLHAIPAVQVRRPDRAGSGPFRQFFEVDPGDGNFQAPAFVLVSTGVECAPNVGSQQHALHIETLEGISGVDHQVVVQDPAGVHFQAEVRCG